MIENSEQLGDFLKKEASRAGASLAHDTHYDAGNWELQWWRGKTLHRLDFQPMKKGGLVITRYRDHFKVLPRLLRWAHNAVPMFPYLATIEFSAVANESFPVSEERVSEVIGAQQGVPADRPRLASLGSSGR